MRYYEAFEFPVVQAVKILHVGKYFSPFSGGLENYMRDLMAALGKRGVGAAALVHRHSWSLKTQQETFNAGGQDFLVVRTGRVANILFTPISPAFPWRLRRLIRSFEPHLLHLHMPNPSAFWALLLPSARRVPWLVHWHSDVITSAQGWPMKLMYSLYRPFEKALLKRARAIVVTSAPYLESSKPLEPWKPKCHVVPLGMDAERFGAGVEDTSANGAGAARRPATQAPGPAPPLRVLAVGRLTYYKGIRYLVEATAKMEGMGLDLIGQGDQMKELQARVADLKLHQRVTFHGAVDDRELARQIMQCDCLCLPSIERTEAFGMVLLEAMYFGKATVVSDVPGAGMGWIIDHGITGIKVRPADADALADAFRHLAADRDALRKMGQNGKEKFDRQFEIGPAADGIMDVYLSIIPNQNHDREGNIPDDKQAG